MKYEIRQIDAVMYDDGWVWNYSFPLGSFFTKSLNPKKAFYSQLKSKGITFKSGSVVCNDEGMILEIVERKTGKPIFAAVPCYF